MTAFDPWNAPLDAPRPEPVKNDAGWGALLGSGESWDDFVHGIWQENGGLYNEKQALTVAAIYACVNLISGAIAAISVNIFGRKLADGERNQIFDDPLWWILNEEMTPRWSAAIGWEFLMTSLLLLGDAFAQIIRDRNGIIKGIRPLHPNRVTVLYQWQTDRLVYSVAPDPLALESGTIILDQDDMLHIPGLGFDGLRGLSPLRFSLRNAGTVAMATQDYAARFFKNHARPDYTLETDQPLEPAVVERMREMAAERNGGKNAHKPMVLTNGLKFHSITMNPEDTQLILTRNFEIEEIARIYGVPPFMIGHNEKTTSWGSGIEAMGTAFVRYALRQHIHKIQVEGNRKCFRTAAKVMEFDTYELERADMVAQFTAFRIGLGRAGEKPFMTTDEVRAKLSMNKIGELAPNPPAAPGTQTAKEDTTDASQAA